MFFFYNDTGTHAIYPYCHPRSRHYALPISAAVGAGLGRGAFGLRLQEVRAERPTGEASLQVVDLELVGVAFVFFGEQQAIVVRVAPDRKSTRLNSSH